MFCGVCDTFDQTKKIWKTKFSPEDYKRPVKLKNDLINFTNDKIRHIKNDIKNKLNIID